MSFIIIYITHSSETNAKKIVTELLQERIVACGNVFPIQSQYWWQNVIQNDDEWVSIVKTSLANKEKTIQFISKIHDYEVPCIMYWEVNANESYENFINQNVI